MQIILVVGMIVLILGAAIGAWWYENYGPSDTTAEEMKPVEPAPEPVHKVTAISTAKSKHKSRRKL